MKKIIYLLIFLGSLITAYSQNSLIVTWDVLADVEGYYVYTKPVTLTNWTKIQKIGSTNVFATIPILPNQLYQTYVTAYKSTNESLPSNQIRNQVFYVNEYGNATAITLPDVNPTNVLGFTLVSGPTNGILGGGLPTIVFIPDSNFVSKDKVVYKSPEVFGDSNVTNYYGFVKINSNFVPTFGSSP